MIIEKPSRTYAWFHDVTTLDIEVSRGEGIGAHKVLAGSPIDENGNVANDETAIGLLMETVSDTNPNGKIIVAGDVDALNAKNASGIELSDAAKNALSGITWREPDYVVEMPTGGGGGGMMVVTITGTEEDGYTADKTAKEIYEAMPNVICKIAAGDSFEFCNAYSCSKGQDGGIEFYSAIFNNVIASDFDDDGNITFVDSTMAKIESVAGNETVQVIYGEKEF